MMLSLVAGTALLAGTAVESDRAAVAALDTEYQAAVARNDAATMSRILADDFVRPRTCTEMQAVALARLLLRDNVQRIFQV